jgi:hypothetical protein
MFFFNPMYWLFVAPALLLMLYAQWRVKSAYAKWSQVGNSRRLTGKDAVQKLMQENGLIGLSIQGIGGNLSDNYDPRNKTLNLSQGSSDGTSVASLAIVAHELGHAQQDAQGSLLLHARGALVPAVNFGSTLGPWIFLAGFWLQFTPLVWLGIGLFSLAFVFALLTLPVELDASSRAMHMLVAGGFLVGHEEEGGARAVLDAAALTYVAAMLMALMQLLYYVFLAFSGRRRR